MYRTRQEHTVLGALQDCFFPFTLAIVTLAVTLMYAPVSLGVPLLVHRYAARDAKIGEK